MNNLTNINFKQSIYKIIDNKEQIFIATYDDDYIIMSNSDKNFNTFLNALKINKSIKMLKFKNLTLTQKNFEKLSDFMQYNKTINKLIITNNDLFFINKDYLKSYDNLMIGLNTFISLNVLNENDKTNLQNKIIDQFLYKNPIYNMIINNNHLNKLKLIFNGGSNLNDD